VYFNSGWHRAQVAMLGELAVNKALDNVELPA